MPRSGSRIGRVLVAGTVVLVVLIAVAVIMQTPKPRAGDVARQVGTEDRSFASNDPLQRACGIDPVLLTRLWRGSDGIHDQDIIFVPHEPNYVGTFDYTSHTGPWDYVAGIPLVLYGPGVVPEIPPVDRPVTLADIYPTVGRLLDLELPVRDGRPLREAIDESLAPPRLIVSIMWDGVGINVLERWPGRWPTLERLTANGVFFTNATIGSSPSITPSTHSTLGVGAFPRDHGVTAIKYRTDDGEVREAFDDIKPEDLRLTTYGDDIDLLLDNEPKVGLVAWQPWHIGMMGHGAQSPGGDKDDLGLITGKTRGELVETNTDYYTAPWGGGAPDPAGLDERLEDLDRADGRADGSWQNQSVAEQKGNPAWVEWEADLMIDLIERRGYGTDDVPDLLFANFKATDLVAHQTGMDSPQMGLVLEAQDHALGRLVDYLEDEVDDFAIILTADHGSTPNAADGGVGDRDGRTHQGSQPPLLDPEGKDVDTDDACAWHLRRSSRCREGRRLARRDRSIPERLHDRDELDRLRAPARIRGPRG